MSFPLAARALQRATSCFAILALAAGSAAAATPPSEFAVSAAQLQSLGIKLLPLAPGSAARGLSRAARVVLPPSQEQVVSAPADGVVDRLLVSGQEPVKAGQPLLRLSSPAYAELQLRLMEAASAAHLSQRALAREQQLLAEGIIPERRVQEMQAAERNAQARLHQVQAALRLAGADAATIRRVSEGGPLDEALTVRAKQAGVVLGLDVKPGQRVKEADALLRLANLHELWLDVELPASADRELASYAGAIDVIGRGVAARAISVGGTVSDSQTVSLRARVTRGAEQLRPGEVVQVQLPLALAQAQAQAQAQTSFALPLQALVRQDRQAYVFVRSDKGFVATPVEVLASAGESVQVSGRLQAGQQLAVSSVIALKAAWLGKSGGN